MSDGSGARTVCISCVTLISPKTAVRKVAGRKSRKARFGVDLGICTRGISFEAYQGRNLKKSALGYNLQRGEARNVVTHLHPNKIAFARKWFRPSLNTGRTSGIRATMHGGRWRRQRQNLNRLVLLRKRGIHSTAEPLTAAVCVWLLDSFLLLLMMRPSSERQGIAARSECPALPGEAANRLQVSVVSRKAAVLLGQRGIRLAASLSVHG